MFRHTAFMCFIKHCNISDKVNEENKNERKQKQNEIIHRIEQMYDLLKVNTYTTNTIGIFCSLDE